jgi:hypothetical protein
MAMQFRIEFLDASASVIRELFAGARNAVGAIALVADIAIGRLAPLPCAFSMWTGARFISRQGR